MMSRKSITVRQCVTATLCRKLKGCRIIKAQN